MLTPQATMPALAAISAPASTRSQESRCPALSARMFVDRRTTLRLYFDNPAANRRWLQSSEYELVPLNTKCSSLCEKEANGSLPQRRREYDIFATKSNDRGQPRPSAPRR